MDNKDKIKLTSFSSGAGWACKLSPDTLSQVLRTINQDLNTEQAYGFESMDDCCIYTLDSGDKIIQSVDFFTPIVDNPYDFGKIAAANSLSDIYAMGGVPLFALNILAFPTDDLPNEVMADILKGGANIAKEAGIPILGGHSIKDKEPKYGMVVTGKPLKDRLIKNSSSQSGDHLILTKPIGTGIITTALKKGLASEEQLKQVTETMIELNSKASKVMVDFEVNACTDVTGYGLLGHLSEMCEGSNLTAHINFEQIKFLGGVFEMAQKNIVPGGSKRNLEYVSKKINFSDNIAEFQKLMLADAQTSGGLLMSCPDDRYEEFLKVLSWEIDAFEIGSMIDRADELVRVT